MEAFTSSTKATGKSREVEEDSTSDSGSDWDAEDRREAFKEICKHLKPDPITGEIGDADILRYVNDHTDDPYVQRVFATSDKRTARKEKKRQKAIDTFNPANLKIMRGAAWLISLEYSGLTTEANWDDDWNFGDDTEQKKKRAEERNGPPKQTFQLHCYIREGPEVLGGASDDSRSAHSYVGLPTWKEIEDFVKVCMAAPFPCWTPCIPQSLYFSNNLKIHEASLRPFLLDMPLPFSYLFEPDHIHAKVRDSDYKKAAAVFREYIDLYTALKDEGNEAFKRGDREAAVAKFQEAAEGLDKLLFKTLSAEPDRDSETRTLLAVCMSNCAAARLLVVDGEKDTQGAIVDAERAIEADADYAKSYIRLARAYEALGDNFAAQKSLVRGLRRKKLEDHFGLADHLISLQTGSQGLSSSKKADFDAWLKRILVEDEQSAELLNGLRGAWKRRCDDHKKNLERKA